MRFPRLQRLSLHCFSRDYALPGGSTDLLYVLSLQSPALVELNLFLVAPWAPTTGPIPLRTYVPAKFLGSRAHFRTLTIFRLRLFDREPLDLDDEGLRALCEFIQKHAQTLRVLKLPSYVISDSPNIRAHVPDLHWLRTGALLLPHLIPAARDGKRVSNIRELSVDMSILHALSSASTVASPFDLGSSNKDKSWIFPNLRSLTIRHPGAVKIICGNFPSIFPVLEEVYLDFSTAMRGEEVQGFTFICTYG